MPAKKAQGKVSTASKRMTRKTTTGSARAGVTFPVGRLNRMMRKSRLSERSSATAGCYMAGVLEYLVAEVLELAGANAKNRRHKTIQPKDINLAIRGDDELSKLMCDATIAQGSVVPHIHDQLLPKKKQKIPREEVEADATQPL